MCSLAVESVFIGILIARSSSIGSTATADTFWLNAS